MLNSKYPVYTCTRCGETKSSTRENFSTRNGKPRLPCRACKRKYDNEHASNNREFARARARKRKEINENIGYANEHHKYRESLLNAQQEKCYFCDSHITIYTIEVDHLIPVTRGGTNDYNNLAGCCSFCNKEKHNKTEDEYRLWRKNTYKNFRWFSVKSIKLRLSINHRIWSAPYAVDRLSSPPTSPSTGNDLAENGGRPPHREFCSKVTHLKTLLFLRAESRCNIRCISVRQLVRSG